MEPEKKEIGPLQLVLQKLGPKTNVMADTLSKLRERGVKIQKSTLYNNVAAEVPRQEVADAFLEATEAEFARRRAVEERACQLVAE